jgi:hypothetical protein
MKAISHFVRTTILGGALFLAPIVALAFILGKAYDFARRGLQPVASFIPDRFASAPTMSAILAIFVLALACFLAGLLARTVLAQKIVGGLEAAVLSKLPGYEYPKQAGTSALGLSESAQHPVVPPAALLGKRTRVVKDGPGRKEIVKDGPEMKETAATKGRGVIKAINERVSPRVFRQKLGWLRFAE